jgi:hypothetical protein
MAMLFHVQLIPLIPLIPMIMPRLQLVSIINILLYRREHLLTLLLGTGSTALTRENFDATVAKWETANPHLVDKLAPGAVETVWQHLSGNATSSQKKKRSTSQPHAPLHKRQNATQSDVDAARKLVAAAQAEAGAANAYRLKHPRRNQYTNRPTNGTSSKMRARDVSSSAVNSTVVSAAALVAEADAALLASNGSLFKGEISF